MRIQYAKSSPGKVTAKHFAATILEWRIQKIIDDWYVDHLNDIGAELRQHEIDAIQVQLSAFEDRIVKLLSDATKNLEAK